MKQPTKDLRLGVSSLGKVDIHRLVLGLTDLISRSNGQLNQLTEGQIAAVHNAGTAAPTTGTFKQGDQIRNLAPTELGAATAKYVIVGWICTVGGTPGTWLDMRVLTGN